MERQPVQSSNLVSVGYEPDTSTLEVEFHSSGIYQYFGVPAETHQALMDAGSKGNYFNHNVKNAGYQCARVG